MSSLPVRDIADLRFAELFGPPGCPLCRQRARSVARYIDAFLWECVTDVGFRTDLDVSRGFCHAHTRQVLAADRRQSGGPLGATILFGAILAIRLREIDELRARRRRVGRRRTSFDDVRRAARCPVCEVAARSEADAATRFVELAASPAWADALSAAELCLDHLLVLMEAGLARDDWRAVEDRQVARLRRLDERIQGFLDHSSHGRRELMTESEQAAPGDVAHLLAGDA